MTHSDVLHHVDHTLLKADATWEDIYALCEEAVAHATAGVCIPPCYVGRVKEAYPRLNVCTVIGFPLGYSVPESKLCEAKQAVADGADEIDMVINISDLKNGLFDKVAREIGAVREVVGERILKVIIEACYLTQDEKIKMCGIITEQKVDYIKTSTGFGVSGARLSDIALFKEHIGPGVRIKAAGGIKTVAALEEFLSAGCDRIGSSSAVSMLAEVSSEQ